MPEYSVKIIDELKYTLHTIGIKRTIDALQKARMLPFVLHTHFVTEMVCGEFAIDIEQVAAKTGYQDGITYCRAFIVHYLRDLEVDWPHITVLLQRTKSSLFRCSKLVNELDIRLSHHQGYYAKKQLFDLKISQYKTQLKK